jgi:hypothetical protein
MDPAETEFWVSEMPPVSIGFYIFKEIHQGGRTKEFLHSLESRTSRLIHGGSRIEEEYENSSEPRSFDSICRGRDRGAGFEITRPNNHIGLSDSKKGPESGNQKKSSPLPAALYFKYLVSISEAGIIPSIPFCPALQVQPPGGQEEKRGTHEKNDA